MGSRNTRSDANMIKYLTQTLSKNFKEKTEWFISYDSEDILSLREQLTSLIRK